MRKERKVLARVLTFDPGGFELAGLVIQYDKERDIFACEEYTSRDIVELMSIVLTVRGDSLERHLYDALLAEEYAKLCRCEKTEEEEIYE